MLNPLAEPFAWNEYNYVTNTENIKNSDLDNEIDSFKAVEQLRIKNTNRIVIGPWRSLLSGLYTVRSMKICGGRFKYKRNFESFF